MIKILFALLFGFSQFLGLGEHLTYQVPETGEVYTIEFANTDSWDIYYTCDINIYEGESVNPVNLIGNVHMDTSTHIFLAEDDNDVPHPLPQISCLPNGGNPILSVISYTKESINNAHPIEFSHMVALPIVTTTKPVQEPPIIVDVQSVQVEWVTAPITNTVEVDDAQAIPSVP